MESSNVPPAAENPAKVTSTNGKNPGQDGRPPGRRNLLLEAMNSVENQERLKKREVLLAKAEFHKAAYRQKLLLEGNLPSPDGSVSSPDLIASHEPEPITSAGDMSENDVYSWKGDYRSGRSNSSCEGSTSEPNLTSPSEYSKWKPPVPKTPKAPRRPIGPIPPGLTVNWMTAWMEDLPLPCAPLAQEVLPPAEFVEVLPRVRTPACYPALPRKIRRPPGFLSTYLVTASPAWIPPQPTIPGKEEVPAKDAGPREHDGDTGEQDGDKGKKC